MKKVFWGLVVLVAACIFVYWTNILPKRILKSEMGIDVNPYQYPKKLSSSWDGFVGDGYSAWKFSKKSEKTDLKDFYCGQGFSVYQKKYNDMLSIMVARELGTEGICFKERNDSSLGDRYLVFYNQTDIVFIIISQ